MSTYMYTHVSNKNIPFGPQRWMRIVWSCFQQKSELSGQWTYNNPSWTVIGMVTMTKICDELARTTFMIRHVLQKPFQNMEQT
ncbi:hypothetical protein V8E54_013326 [Elaphomyces granulatus]